MRINFEEIRRQTAKAILIILADGREVWIPASQSNGWTEFSVDVPEWLATEKDLVSTRDEIQDETREGTRRLADLKKIFSDDGIEIAETRDDDAIVTRISGDEFIATRYYIWHAGRRVNRRPRIVAEIGSVAKLLA